MTFKRNIMDSELEYINIAQPIELVVCGNTAHLKSSNVSNNTTKIVKIDKDRYFYGDNLNGMNKAMIESYINLCGQNGCTFDTNIKGEIVVHGLYGDLKIGYFEHNEKRVDDVRSVRRSVGELRDLINTNIENGDYCRFLTLTYSTLMLDSKKVCDDFHNFNKRLRKYHKGHNLPFYDYISVKEPQSSGSWHLHVLLIYKTIAPFLDNNSVISNCWKQGFTKITKVDSVDNVGAYLSAYLCNDLDDSNASNHKIEKGKRLHYYKKGERFYSYSKGIKKPKVLKMSHQEAIEYLFSNDYHLTFQKKYNYVVDNVLEKNDDNEYCNREFEINVISQYFNK